MSRYALLLCLLVGCPQPPSCDPPTSVEGDPEPPPPPPPPRPPRVDEPFDLSGGIRGVIAFGLGHPGQSEEDVIAFVNAVMSQGWTTIQPCAETEFWDDSHAYPRKPRSATELAQFGPPMHVERKQRDESRLDWLLDIMARVPRLNVTLVVNCTLKRQVPLEEQRQWARRVAEIAKPYKNVAIYTHNELQNCEGRSDWGGRKEWCADKEEARWHVNFFRSQGFQVTLDDGVCNASDRDSNYQFRFANTGARPASFHPCRTDQRGRPWDPDRRFLRRMAEVNGTFLLSETVAWADFSGICTGLRTCDPLRLERYIGDCAAVPECSFTFHCENCLNGAVPTYIPRAR